MLDQLRADLAEHADISDGDGDGSGSGWVIARYDRETFSPAVLFACTEEGLAQCLDASSTDAAFLFPDVPPVSRRTASCSSTSRRRSCR